MASVDGKYHCGEYEIRNDTIDLFKKLVKNSGKCEYEKTHMHTRIRYTVEEKSELNNDIS